MIIKNIDKKNVSLPDRFTETKAKSEKLNTTKCNIGFSVNNFIDF